jgi:hypothetical protein
MGRINPVQTSSSHMGDKDKIQGFDLVWEDTINLVEKDTCHYVIG